MLISIIRYINGYLRICVAGYSPERFLNLCSHHQIYLWGLTPRRYSYEMYITVKEFRKLKPILKKTNTKVTIVKRYGLPFFLHKYRKRKTFFVGALLGVILIYVLSIFIWNIHIDGNLSLTDETILEYLKTESVYHGMKKSQVNCNRIVKDLRQKYDTIIWVSAWVKGTRLMIRVKENTDTIPIKDCALQEPRDIIATKDGEILQIVTRTGVPKVFAGTKVKAGDLLVSGRLEVQNDNKEVIAYQYQMSDADILGKTILPYEEKITFSHRLKKYIKGEKRRYYIKTKQHIYFFGSLKNSTQKSEQFLKEVTPTFGKYFTLPFTYGSICFKPYTFKKETLTKKEVHEKLSGNFQRFCKDLDKKGVQILENDVKIYTDEKSMVAKGTLTVAEPIGTAVATEVVDLSQNTEQEGKDK
ncbi:MAG: sporulation protein YqfD [Lachnospiraceae bacterium]